MAFSDRNMFMPFAFCGFFLLLNMVNQCFSMQNKALQLSESQQKRPERLAHVRNAELVKKFEVTEVDQLPESVAASRS